MGGPALFMPLFCRSQNKTRPLPCSHDPTSESVIEAAVNIGPGLRGTAVIFIWAPKYSLLCGKTVVLLMPDIK